MIICLIIKLHFFSLQKKAQYQEIGYDFNPLKIKILGNENRQSEPPIFVKKTESFHNKPSFPCFPSLQLKSDNAQVYLNLNFQTRPLDCV